MDTFTDIELTESFRVLIPTSSDASRPDGDDDLKYLADADSRQYGYPGYCVVA